MSVSTKMVFLDLDNTVWYGGHERHGFLFSELLHRLEHGRSLAESIELTPEDFLAGWRRYAALLHLTAPEQLEVFLTQLAEGGYVQAGDVRDLYRRCARWMDERYLHSIRSPDVLMVAGPEHERGRAMTLVPGVVRVFDELRRARRLGVRVAALTLNLEHLSTQVLDHFGILDAFDEVLGTAWERPTISKAERVRAVTARLGISPVHTLVVGDSPGDVACARAVGAASLAVATGPTTAQELMAAGPDEVIRVWPTEAGPLRRLLGLEPAVYVGIDVGGTKTRAALVDVWGRPASSVHTTRTPSVHTHPAYDVGQLQRALVEHIGAAYDAIREEAGTTDVAACGVSFAGVVLDRRTVVKAADLFGAWGTWSSEAEIESKPGPADAFPLGGLLEETTGARWLVENDLVAALFRYSGQPRHRALRSMCLLTVSTGIGYAVLDRDAPPGRQMRLVSLGHHTIDRSPDAVPCDCGGAGHLTSYASGRGVADRLREAAKSDLAGFARSSLWTAVRDRTEEHALEPATLASRLENVDLVTAVRAGDAFALRVLHASVDRLAAGVCSMLEREAAVERVILCGGFLHATADAYLPRLVEALTTVHGLDPHRLRTLFVLGESDDLDGVVGAASLAALDRSDRARV